MKREGGRGRSIELGKSMCSSILGPIMDENNNNNNNNNNYQGDLTDILLRSGAAAAYGSSSTSASSRHHQQHLSSSGGGAVIEEEYYPMMMRGGSNSMMFGDPFSTMRDPFLHDLAAIPADDIIIPPTSYFNTTPPPLPLPLPLPLPVRPSSSPTPPTCNNIFSNMIHISPNNNNKLLLLPYDSSNSCSSSSSNSSSSSQAMPAAAASSSSSSSSPSTAIMKPNIMLTANNNKDSNLMDININNTTSLQISSPRNPPLKRRKNQAKKVVCIPAPAAANSRQTGEVVPSDLWAWRKYGQKPIKGSPYPRGYYRCSSSKGCSARKQVERSRTDPNMLVITYTSEHNHPWPTQRNALAGSTRSQPSKNSTNNASKNSSETSHQHQKGTTPTKAKEENHHQQQPQAEIDSEGNNNNNDIVSSPVMSASVKEEMEDIEKQLLLDESMMMGDDGGEFSSDGPSVLPNYKPSMMMMMDDDDDDQGNNNNNSEDFFAELGEIEADPLNLLFSTTHQGFINAGAGADHQIQPDESKALDPFNIFDWSSGGDTTNTNSSFQDHNNKGRL